MENTSKEAKKVHFVSLGCPKNLVDSEIMLGHLMKSSYEITDNPEEADTVIVNTCGFIEEAKRESIATILEMAALKEKSGLKNLVVAGCLTQRYKDDLVNDLPEADIFIGSGEFHRISEILEAKAQGSTKKTYFNLPTYLQEESSPRVNSQPRHRAYLKISEGCLKRCAFCAIPVIRGNLQSRHMQAVVNEAKLLVAGGVKELLVVSHDFTDYGWDLRKKNAQAPETPFSLLKALSDESGAQWIRLLYLYPDGITPDLVQLIKERDNLVKYFDMPLQHINDEMLKRMNRKMTRKEVEEAVANIRREIPDAVIRTQFIVGFPGETEEQFEEVISFIKEQEFDRVGCFKYSPEENTAGGRMEQTVSEQTKDLRYKRLMSVQKKISLKKQKKMIGKIVDVIVEGTSDETDLLLKGRSSQQAPDIDGITLINSGTAQVGDIVKLRITQAMDYDLVGEMIEKPSVDIESHEIIESYQ